MGLLEGYFVPLYSFHLTPEEFEQKVGRLFRIKFTMSRVMRKLFFWGSDQVLHIPGCTAKEKAGSNIEA